MEFANLATTDNQQTNPVRVAGRSDMASIMELLRTAVYSHMHVDWYLPGDWIGRRGFVVSPKPIVMSHSISSKLFGSRDTAINGCVAITADPAPAAWVRIAAIGKDAKNPRSVLADMSEKASCNLSKTAVNSIAWLTIQDWPNQWMDSMGFKCVNKIETYIKDNMHIPPIPNIPNLSIRPVLNIDINALALLEKEAFNPLWRHSANGLEMAQQQAFSFDVALLEEEIVGFQLSTPSDYGVHLVRLTINPHIQRSGIGTALLAHAIRGYHRRGRNRVTLNTQIDNTASQYLYRKFGFHPNQQRYPVWAKRL